MPLVLAALHGELDRGLVVLLPEDADARDAAEAAAWFLGPEQVALLPSRGVHWGSGLDPHRISSASAPEPSTYSPLEGWSPPLPRPSPKDMPPAGERPEPIRLPIADDLAERLALAGYEQVERAEERGQFAVRGGIIDVFPTTTGPRIELFGDEIESIRAFSPFTQRTLHSLDEAVIYPATERRDLDEPTLVDQDEAVPVPDDLVPPLGRAPDFVWQPDAVREVWSEEELEPRPLDGAVELDPFPSGQPFAFEAQRPAIAARGLAEAENRLGALVRAGLRVVVAFAHQGEALRNQNLLRRVESRLFEAGDELPGDAELLYAVSPARRGFVWRDLGIALLPDTQVFRRKPRAAARVGRSLQSFADLRTGDHVVHEDHGVSRLWVRDQGGRRGNARLPAARVPRRRSPLRPARAARQGLALRRDERDAGALEARREGLATPQEQGPGGHPRLASELLRLAQRQQAPGFAHDLRQST